MLTQFSQELQERTIMTIITDKYTKNCKVLMSFGAKDGGYELVSTLREELMELRGWSDPCSIYLDGPSTKTITSVNKKQIAIDYGESYWKALFKAAMRQSKAMVFVVTSQWARSHWCSQEHQWFNDIRMGHHGLHIPISSHLPIVVIGFEKAFSLLETGTTDLILAQGAARVSSTLASVDPSLRLVKKDIRHTNGSMFIIPTGSS